MSAEVPAEVLAAAAATSGGPRPKQGLSFVQDTATGPLLCLSEPSGAVACPVTGAYPGPRDPRGERSLLIAVEDGAFGHRERLAWWDGAVKPLTEWTTSIKAPQWSPDGSTVVFASPVDGVSAIWSVTRDGGTPVLEDATALGNFEPVAAPDGTVAFGSSRDGNAEIYLKGSDALERVTDHPGDDVRPGWSPDGRLLTWLRTEGGVQRVWTRGPAGIAPLTTAIQEQVGFEWSPDGQAIAVAERHAGGSRIAVYTAAGAELSTIELAGGALRPTWSPDARWLAFESTVDGQPVVMTAHRSGRDPKVIATGWLPRWR